MRADVGRVRAAVAFSCRKSTSSRPDTASAPSAAPSAAPDAVDDCGLPLLPSDLIDEDALLLCRGQLIQTSKQRKDGWAFGSVVFDEVPDRAPIGIEGLSTQAGWFPLAFTTHPSSGQLESLQKSMGGDAAKSLAPPSTWVKVADPSVPQTYKLPDSEELRTVSAAAQARDRHAPATAHAHANAHAHDVLAHAHAHDVRAHAHAHTHVQVRSAFLATLGSHIEVVEVERVQNVSMWQSFAVKRQTILQREADDPAVRLFDASGRATGQVSRYEKIWLFHGTDREKEPPPSPPPSPSAPLSLPAPLSPSPLPSLHRHHKCRPSSPISHLSPNNLNPQPLPHPHPQP